MPRSGRRSPLRVFALVLFAAFAAAPAAADEIWVAPTSQTDVGGIGVANNVLWPVTPRSAVRLAWSVPDNLQTFQGAKLVLVSDVVLASTTVNVLVCAAANSQAVTSNCSATPVPHVVSTAANTLREVDISAALAPFVGAAGQRHIAVLAYTPALTTTTHLVGLRFTYAPKPPTGVATLGANTFTGTQTATAFVGDGSGLTNLPAPSGAATLGANTFSGTQSAPAFVGDGTGLGNVNANLLDGLDSTAFAGATHGHNVTQVTGAARLAGGNLFAGTQRITVGNVDLEASTSATGAVTVNGSSFLHSFGTQNTFLGLNAGNFQMTGTQNIGLGPLAMASNTTGVSNVAAGVEALRFNTTGSANVAIGPSSLKWNTEGSSNSAIGFSALSNNTTGLNNVAAGAGALFSNLSGFQNTAVGTSALSSNTIGGNNVAVGSGTLFANTSGNLNTAIGQGALASNTTGLKNVALGVNAGLNATTGSSNIYLGADVVGVAGESNAMYLGRVGTQFKTVIAGVRGTAVSGGEMVVVDPDGRLGSAAVPVGGGGDVTGVAAGLGLTGGGTSGDVGVSLDLTYTDTRYASIAHGHDVSAISGAATAGANTFTGTQTINTGNLDLDPSTATGGLITKNGARFIHDVGFNNIFLGVNAGTLTNTGVQNVAVGTLSMGALTTGQENVAIGPVALQDMSTATMNTAVGSQALRHVTTEGRNTALGRAALSNNIGGFNTAVGANAAAATISGTGNTVVGESALFGNSTGSNNVAVGLNAGTNSTTGANNIYLGADVGGVAGESNTMYLGKVGTQTKTVVAGVRGTPVTGAEMVVVDANGRFGSAPVPVGGGGDITGVAAGTGLTGGGTSGDVGLSLELAYTDARYASFVHGHNVSAITGAATTGANTFTGTQTINTGNLDLDASTSTTGNITKDGQRFLHDFGSNNLFLGASAGNFSMTSFGNVGIGPEALFDNTTGTANVGVGRAALQRNTTGQLNTAVGDQALQANTTGYANTAVGRASLGSNTTGSENTALGLQALSSNTSGGANTGSGSNALSHNTSGIGNTADGYAAMSSNTVGNDNTASGSQALINNISGNGNVAFGSGALIQTIGSGNVGIGYLAGSSATTGSNNIYLGAGITGVAAESNTMYLGKVGTQTRTVIAGVRGTTTGVNDAVAVVIDSNGQLGTISSSARYKEDIHDLGAASRRLFNLRPVTFRYTQPFAAGVKPVQFGLIAEEVAQVFPELAVLNADGQPETVKYQDLSVLLLNEVQRQQETIDRQARELDAERQRVDALERKLQLLLERVGGVN